MGSRCALLAACVLLPITVSAEVPEPGDEAARLVAGVSEALFDLLPTEDHTSARAFFAPGLAEIMTAGEWIALRERISEEAGETPRYLPHGLTFYPQAEALMAAVDFWGETAEGKLICGYLIWAMPEANTIGLERIEEAIVDPELFRAMPVEEAAGTLASWRCPPTLIQSVLGLSKPQ